jgi:hypothetical protein
MYSSGLPSLKMKNSFENRVAGLKGVYKKLKLDGLHLVRISIFSLQLLQIGHKGNWGILTHGWKNVFGKLTHYSSGNNLNVITVLQAALRMPEEFIQIINYDLKSYFLS